MANDMERFKSGDIPAHWGFSVTQTYHNDIYPAIDPAKVKFDDGYTVCITGASYGLGEHTAKAFASAGASNIVITARSADKLEKVKQDILATASKDGRNISVSTYAGDATQPKTYEQLHDLIVQEYAGRLDCLICNAGGVGTATEGIASMYADKFHKMNPEHFHSMTELNYLSAFYAAHRLVPLMLNPQSKGRTVVNVTSGASQLVDAPSFVYNLSKFTLNRFTQALGATYKDEGLFAVAMHPGIAPTPGADAVAPHVKLSLTDDVKLSGAVCVWLANSRPEYLSGRYMMANWDVDELESQKDEIVKHDKFKFRMVV